MKNTTKRNNETKAKTIKKKLQKRTELKRTISIQEYETCDERVCHILNSYRIEWLKV